MRDRPSSGPRRFPARIVAGQALAEQGNAAAAETALRQNLDGGLLTPESVEARDSLFELGELLAEQDRHADAFERLSEAIGRYPDAKQTPRACYLAARCCAQLAAAAEHENHRDEARKWLMLAVERCARSRPQSTVAGRRPNCRASIALLRNACFAAGAVTTALEQIPAAIDDYVAIVRRLPNEPETLEAYVQLASCLARYDRPRELRATVAQARLLLSRVDPAALAPRTTNDTQLQWSQLLDWLDTL